MASSSSVALRDLRADVVCLVQNDEHGLALGAPLPEVSEDSGRGEVLLFPRRQRAEVDDEAARPRPTQLVQQGALVPGGPHLPAVDAEVLNPPAENRRLTIEQFPKGLGGGRRDSCLRLLEELDELRVLVPVVNGVEPQEQPPASAGRARQSGVATLGPTLRGVAHDDPRRGLSVAVREPFVDALP